jgi:hypothetical protein
MSNTTGFQNTADGYATLAHNTQGTYNTANGYAALSSNTNGYANTANGYQALYTTIISAYNTANGYQALFSNTTGYDNTAAGTGALFQNTTGMGNTALGYSAGGSITTGSGNVCIGYHIYGDPDDTNTTRIANIWSSVVGGAVQQVYVDPTNKLGTLSSSRRYKEQINPMDKASEKIFSLRPVTFRYKKEVDRTQCLAFGLIAEEVTEVNPELVTRDAEGNPKTVRYDAVNAMLLNEFLKEHRKNEEQRKDFEAAISRQQKQIDALTAVVQKVSAQLELNNTAPQTVLNNQ